MGHDQKGAEPAGLGLQPLDLRDGVVGRADDDEARRIERIDQRVEVLRVGRQGQGGHLLEVVDPLLEAVGHVGARLLHGLGDVHRPDEAPVVAVDDGRELLGPLLQTSQWAPSTSKPPADVAPMDRRPQPQRPAVRGPDGDTEAATATSGKGRW